MTNKIGNKRYNKLLSYRNNYYNIGGALNKLYNALSGNPDKNGNITFKKRYRNIKKLCVFLDFFPVRFGISGVHY